MRVIGGDCSRPIGAYARLADTGTDGVRMIVDALVASPDGKDCFSTRAEAEDSKEESEISARLLRSLRDQGLEL